jgi:phosphatidylethanolamine-binding protein (PEBP) family uncharacterized protein
MKFRLRKTQKRKKIKRKTFRRYMGGNQLVVKYDNIPIQGQRLEKDRTVSPPTIEFQNTGKLYTLVMWDPDVPPQAQPGFVHWLATNLRSQSDIRNNQVLEYKGPNPPSGVHRYFFGLFEQQGMISPQQPERTQFSISKFVQENNLQKVYDVFMKVASINV